MKLPFYRTREALREYDHDASTRMQAILTAPNFQCSCSAHIAEAIALENVQNAFYLDAAPLISQECSKMVSLDFIRYLLNAKEPSE